MLEDLLDEMLIEPEVQKQSKEVTMETLKQYSDRRRQKDIQQVAVVHIYLLVGAFSLFLNLSVLNLLTSHSMVSDFLDPGDLDFAPPTD